MVRPAHTARSERTRDALRRAALVRFLAQGVEDTSAEQIAADAGVSLRTFYRHFASKHDLLFADYDAGLQWFRTALLERSPQESIIESVQSAIFAFPYDTEAVTQIAALRARELDPGASSGIPGNWRRTSPTPSSNSSPAVRTARRETSGCTPSSPRAASPRPSSGRWRCGWSGRTVRSTN